VPLTDSIDGVPVGTMAVPGRPAGLQLFLDRDDSGDARLLVLPYAVTGASAGSAGGGAGLLTGQPLALGVGPGQRIAGTDVSVALRGVSSYSVLIAKRDPGQGLVWLAFGLLISGVGITFYLPRRRVWARVGPDGSLALVARSDRYVDLDREFGALIDDLVARRAASLTVPPD
jgi:hypothetical protein